MGNLKDSGERLIPEKSDRYWYFNHLARYTFARSFVDNKIVLDAGCGEGYGASILAGVARNVVGIDVDENVIERAYGEYKTPNLKFSVMDCCCPGFVSGSFDVVCSFEVIEHVKKCEQYISEIHRILKKGGLFIVSTPNKERYPMAGLNPFHEREFTLEEFRGLLEAAFDDVNIYGQRCKLKARQLYHIPLARLIYKIRRLSGIRIRFSTKFRELLEKKLTGHSIQEVRIEDFFISKNNLEWAENFIAVCYR